MRKLHRHLFTLCAAVILLFSFAATAGEMGNQLQQYLNKAPSNEIITVFVKPKSGFSLSALDGMPRDMKLRTIMRARASAQAPLIRKLQPLAIKGMGLTSDNAGESGVTPLWIANVIIVHTTAEGAKEIADDPEVEKVFLDRVMTLQESVTNLYARNAYELELKRGISTASFTYGLKQIGIPYIRDHFGATGKGVLVGQLDTGVNANHPALRGKVVKFKDFIQNKTEPYDDHGHGTHTAGTIAGSAVPGAPLFGIAPDVKLVVAKIFSKYGSTTESAILQAMQWIADPDGDPSTDDAPKVINNSWGGPTDSLEEERPSWEAVLTWKELGILPVFSAGNSGPAPYTIGSPAAYPHALAVAASDSNENVAYFSSRGPAVFKSDQKVELEVEKPDVTAPGVRVLSASASGGFVEMSGTSMAAPHVTGLVALILGNRPNFTVDYVWQLLVETANYPPSANSDNPYGFDYSYGYGIVDGRSIFNAIGIR